MLACSVSLQTFFEVVEKCITSGVAPAEVSYQLAYSKGELKKAISLYPGK